MGEYTEKIVLQAEDQASGVLGNISGSLQGLASQLLAFAGIAGAGLGLGGLVKAGIDFNSTLEDTQIGIASVLGTLNKYTDATGGLITGQEKFTAAMEDSAGIQEQLKNAALTTTASYVQMVEGFQTGLAPMAKAKIAQGDMVEATQRLTQAMGALGVPMHQLPIEMRQFFEGDFARSRLLQGLQITGDEIKRLSASGGLMDLLRQKTETMGIAADAASQTLTGLKQNLGDIFSQAMGKSMTQVSDAMKGALTDITALFGHAEKAGHAMVFVWDQDILARFKVFGEVVGGLFDVVSTVTKTTMGIVTGSVTENVGTWLDVMKLFGKAVVTDFGLAAEGIGLAFIAIAHPIDAVRAVWDQLSSSISSAMAWLVETAVSLSEKLSSFSSKLALPPSVLADMKTLGASFREQAAATEFNSAANNKFIQGVEDLNRKTNQSIGNSVAAIDKIGQVFSDLTKKTQEHNSTPIEPPITAKTLEFIRNAEQKFENLFATLNNQGLTGLAKSIAETDKRFLDMEHIVEDLLAKAIVEGPKAVAKIKPLVDQFYALEPAAKAAANALNLDKAAKEYTENLNKMLAYTKTSAEATLEVERQTALDKIDIALEVTLSKTQNETDVVRAVQAANAAIRAINKETSEKAVMLNTGQKNDWGAMWGVLVTKAREGAITIQEAYGQLAQKLAKDGTTVADGFLLGFAEIKAKAPSIVHATADLVGGIWQAQGSLFTSVFTNVLAGDFKGLQSTVEGFGKSIAGIFAKYFSEILQSWLLSKMGIEQNPITGKMQMTGGGQMNADGSIMGGSTFGAYAGAAGGVAGAGLTGYGVGAGIGSASGAPGWSVGATTGGTVGGVLGTYVFPGIGTVLGAAIGAILGGIIGALTVKNTSKSIFIEGGKIGPNSNDAASGAILGARDTIAGSIVDMFGSSTQEGRNVFAKSLNTAISDYIKGIKYEAHAGQNEDLQADFKQILTGVIPREMLNQLFGKTRLGGQDMAGISGASKYGYTDVQDGYFKNTAVTQWLQEGLGFTVAKIKEIGMQIDQKEPEDFLKYLGSLVNLVVGFRDLKKNLAMGRDATVADIEREQAKTAVDSFAERAQNLKDLSAELANYTGDAQISHAQQLLGLANQYYQDQRQYLTNLMQLAKDINSSIEDQKRGIRYSLLGTEGQKSFLQKEMEGFQQELLGTSDPSRVKELVAKIQADAGALFNLYGADSPDRTAVANSLIAMLDYVNSIAQQKIKAEEEAVISANAGLPDVMEANKRLFTDVNGALGPLPANVTATSTAFDSATASASRLATVFDRLSDRMMQAFNTQAVSPGGGSTTNGGGGTSFAAFRTYGNEMATRTA